MSASLNAKIENKARRIKSLFDSFDNKELSGGYAIAVLQNSQIIYQKAYGFANHEYEIPFTTQTIFDFASVAKQFTGYCIANLLQQKALSFEEDIRQYIPELPDYGQKITIRHLLGHTSGLRDWYPMIKLAGYSEDDTIGPEFLMKLICRQNALNFTPGSQYAYSNSGYFLLGQLVNRLTGKTLREFADEKIFKPLGMDSTFFGDDPNEIISNRAFPYLGNENNEYGQGANRLAAPGCSSLFSNLEDMITWMQHIDTCVLNKDEIFDMMLQPTPLNDGRKISYNFGIVKGRWRERVCMGHGGGWNAFTCDTSYFPEERTSIIFITNRSPNHVNTSDALRCILFDEPLTTANKQESPALQQPSPINPLQIGDLTGEYYSSEIQTTYTIHVDNERLLMSHLVNEDVVLVEKEPDVFTGNRYWCEEVSFTRDKQGMVDGFRLSANSGNLMKDIGFSRK
jgi:CubicO group peptidase (beta-lactamase class C family)